MATRTRSRTDRRLHSRPRKCASRAGFFVLLFALLIGVGRAVAK